jgi:hypothetical protein
MAESLLAPGGQALFSPNEQITSADLNRISKMLLQTMFNLVCGNVLFRESVAADPKSGFLGDDCKATRTGTLIVTVAKGLGFFYDPDATGEFDYWYFPVVVPASEALAISAHHATLPRKDRIILTPDTTDDEASSVNVKDPATGSVSTSTVYKRRIFGGTLSVLTGTPGSSPTPPALPSGAMNIAVVEVPATSGNVTVLDRRRILRLSQRVIGDPPTEYSEPFITDESGGEVAADSGWEFTVTEGVGVIGGIRIRWGEQNVEVDPAHGSLDRIDTLYLDAEGLGVLMGTPDASPTAPTLTASQLRIADMRIPGGAVDVTTAIIDDSRVFKPVTGDVIRTETIDKTHAVRNRVAGAVVYEKGTPDLNVRVDRGLANVAGTEVTIFGQAGDGLAITAASAGKEKLSIVQVSDAGVLSIKDGAEVNVGTGLAVYPDPDADATVVAKLFTADSPITEATTAITNTNIRNTDRTWF